MQRVKRSTAVVALPSMPSGGTPGYFSNPNPGGGVPATVPGYEWFNSVQEEICAVIAAAGLTLNVNTTNQLLQALPAALASRPEMAKSLAASGYQKVPGGLIVQWGSYSQADLPLGSQNYYVAANQSFPIAFPTACLNMCGSSRLNFCIGQVVPVSASQYTPRFSQSGGVGAINVDVFWVAIGY